jgi:hypothetical protein
MPERIRIDLLNCQVEAFIVLRKIEQACDYLEAAVKACLVNKSERRFQESFALFQEMKKLWSNELRVQRLEDLFMQRIINHSH